MSDQDTIRRKLPNAPIDKVIQPVVRFMHVQAASGVVLLICTIVALVLANSSYSEVFLGFWKTKVGFSFGEFHFEHSLKHLINDGLMAIFFFVIGLEVKRELVLGELRDLRRAILPIAAAIGGMLAPAAASPELDLQWHYSSPDSRSRAQISIPLRSASWLGPRSPQL